MNQRRKIGQNLRKARLKQGMTQAEVAKATGLHTNFYARAERNEETPSMKTLKAICKVLKVRSSDILDF